MVNSWEELYEKYGIKQKSRLSNRILIIAVFALILGVLSLSVIQQNKSSTIVSSQENPNIGNTNENQSLEGGTSIKPKCMSDTDCNDNNASTADICESPGLPSSYCLNILKTCEEQGKYPCDSNEKCNGFLTSSSDSANCCSTNCIKLQCSDGTPYGQCSVTKPKYCDAGALVNKCSDCECTANQTCKVDESCVGVSFDFSLSVNSSSVSVVKGSSAATKITLTLLSGATQTISFRCSGLPTGTSCSFSPTSITPLSSGATSTLEISTISSTPAGVYTITITAAGSVTKVITYTLEVKSNVEAFAELPTVIFDDGSLHIPQTNAPDIQKISQIFYQKYADSYDFLLVFTTTPYALLNNNGFHMVVKNNVQGIGLSSVDNTKSYGSNGKLLGINFDGSLELIQDGIHDVTVENLNNNAADAYVNIFHELNHQWSVYIGCASNLNCKLPVQLPYNLVHWDIGLFTPYEEGTLLFGGHKWIDNNDGTFTSNRYKLCDFKEHFPRFHPLDLYLMGFKSASEVSESYFVVKPQEEYYKAFYFYCDKPTIVRGTKFSFSVQDIIKEYGERMPNYADSQKKFSLAIILLESQNYPATQDMKEKLSSIAKNAPAIWSWLTESRSTLDFPHK